MKQYFSPPVILKIIGYSGSGKTTLIEQLIPYLRKRGLRLAVIKHTSHCHELDYPGKDSHRLRKAGAEAVFVSSPAMVAMFRDVEQEWSVEQMLPHLPPGLDLVIAEGFKSGEHPYIEVFRKQVSKELLGQKDSNLLAIVGDDPGDVEVPRFHRDAILAIGEFVIEHCVKRLPEHAKSCLALDEQLLNE